MPVATRLLVAFVLLICAFVLLVGVAVFSLYTVGQWTLASVVATAGLAGVAAGAVTYWILRREVEEEIEPGFDALPLAEVLLPAEPAVSAMPQMPQMPTAARTRVRRGPLRVQAMPVANLPPAYVDAVLRGAQARLSALKGEPRQQ